MTLGVECLQDEAALETLAPEWEALAATVTPRVPFRSAAWNILWWKHFREQRATVRDELRTYVLRDEQGHLVAVAPMMLTRRPGGRIPLVRELQFFGADPNVTELRGLVCRNEKQPEVIATLQERLMADRPNWDWVQWSGIECMGPSRQTLAENTRMHWRTPTQMFYLELPETWDAFRAELSRNIKESLRKCYNSLNRDGHSFQFKVVSDPAASKVAIERFLELHAERSNLQGTVQHSNVFARSAASTFLFEYCHGLAESGGLRIFQLEIAGCIVATRIGFLFDDELFLYYSGYVQEWGRYSVMTTVVAEALKWAIGNGVRIANLSTGSDVSKTRWSPLEIQYANGLQSASALHSRLSFSVYQSIYRQSRSDYPAVKWLQRARRKA